MSNNYKEAEKFNNFIKSMNTSAGVYIKKRLASGMTNEDILELICLTPLYSVTSPSYDPTKITIERLIINSIFTQRVIVDDVDEYITSFSFRDGKTSKLEALDRFFPSLSSALSAIGIYVKDPLIQEHSDFDTSGVDEAFLEAINRSKQEDNKTKGLYPF